LIKLFKVIERGALASTLARGIRNADAKAFASRSKSGP